MPDGTSKEKWYIAQIIRGSDLTRLLDDLFGDDPRELKQPQHPLEPQYLALKETNALHSGSPQWQNTLKPFLEDELKNYVSDPWLNLSQDELIARVIEHIEDWPNNPDPPRQGKEQLRQALVAAIDSTAAEPIPFQFKWRLRSGIDKEDIEIKPLNKKTKVSFINPKSKEYEDPPSDIRINIGPEV